MNESFLILANATTEVVVEYPTWVQRRKGT